MNQALGYIPLHLNRIITTQARKVFYQESRTGRTLPILTHSTDMARSLRASRKKANKRILRSRVHQPVEDARIERLATKLQEKVENSRSSGSPDEANKLGQDREGKILHHQRSLNGHQGRAF